MFNARSLFNRRSDINRQEVMRYSKFIFNGHFVVFLSIAVGALMLQYSQLLKNLPHHINYHLIIALLLALYSVTHLRTFVRAADEVFLLPYERQLSVYVNRSILQSFIKKAVPWVILFVLLMPLYHAGVNFSMMGMIVALVFGLFAIAAGLWIRWFAMKLDISHLSVNILLFLMAMAGIYNALEGVYFTAVVEVLFFAGLLYLMNNISRNYVFPWERMVEYEQDLTQRQYKTINMFTDVKGLKDNVRRRRYFDSLLKIRPKDYHQNGMFLFLFKRNFMRSKDAFWIIIRLVVVGGVIIWLVRQPVVAMIIGIFIVYIVVLQSSQFYKQQAYQLWPQVWPVHEDKVVDGFRQFLWQLSIVVTVIVAIIYSALYPAHFYYCIPFFIVMWWTNQQVMGKLKKKMTLLRD